MRGCRKTWHGISRTRTYDECAAHDSLFCVRDQRFPEVFRQPRDGAGMPYRLCSVRRTAPLPLADARGSDCSLPFKCESPIRAATVTDLSKTSKFHREFRIFRAIRQVGLRFSRVFDSLVMERKRLPPRPLARARLCCSTSLSVSHQLGPRPSSTTPIRSSGNRHNLPALDALLLRFDDLKSGHRILRGHALWLSPAPDAFQEIAISPVYPCRAGKTGSSTFPLRKPAASACA